MSDKRSSNYLRWFLSALTVLILMWVSFGAGVYMTGKSDLLKDLAKEEVVYIGEVIGKYSSQPEDKVSQDIDFDIFWDVWDTLNGLYVDQDKISDKKLFYGALRGMVAAVGDPYTVFMDPKIAHDFQNDLAGTFEGIGAEIGIKKDILTIIAPLPDMPAETAGLKAGDLVLAIDGESTAGIFIDEAVNKIRGPEGTDVVLTISREGMEEVQDFTITRGKIVVKSVRTSLREDNIYVVKITNFNEDTKNLFNRAIREIIEKNPEGIVLDLRNNPGGFLDTAIEMASEWVDNRIVVVEKYSEDKKIEHLARGRARLAPFPTVVLVNQGSASASEIVSGALQDHGKATIVGQITFGKGSVQTLTDFEDGSSVKVTVAKWLTPSGRSINDEGIEPDIMVELTQEDYANNEDPQLDRAVDILLGKESVEDTDTATTTVDEVSTSTEE
jgi:carboxyl-terminal processing protease